MTWETRREEALRICNKASISVSILGAQATKSDDGKINSASENLALMTNQKKNAERLVTELTSTGKPDDANYALALQGILDKQIPQNIIKAKNLHSLINKDFEETRNNLNRLKSDATGINASSTPAEIDKIIADLRLADINIHKQQSDSQDILRKMTVLAQDNETDLKSNYAYSYRTSRKYEWDKNVKTVSGGKYGLGSQFFGHGPDGDSQSVFEGYAGIGVNSVRGFGEWWTGVKTNTKTQGERNAINIVEQGALFIGALTVLNLVDKYVCGNKMNGFLKFAIMAYVAIKLLERSGKTGQYMVDRARQDSSIVQGLAGSASSNIPNNFNNANQNNSAAGTGTSTGIEVGILNHNKDPVKHTLYTGDGHIYQKHNGCMINQCCGNNVLNFKGQPLSISQKMIQAIKNTVDTDIKQTVDNDRLSGTGSHLANGLKGTLNVTKINGIDLGEKSFTVSYNVPEKYIKDLVPEASTNPLQQAAGT